MVHWVSGKPNQKEERGMRTAEKNLKKVDPGLVNHYRTESLELLEMKKERGNQSLTIYSELSAC